MGLVYEAMDEELDRRVALTCARPGYRDGLPPEVRAARDVSHFNVCKVHDLHLAPPVFPKLRLGSGRVGGRPPSGIASSDKGDYAL
jgi:hypothetical protein